MSNDTYWASLPQEEVGKELEARDEEYKEFLRSSGILAELKKSYRLFYGNSAIQEEADGKTLINVNHYASLIRSIHTSVTNQRPAFQALAVNSDFESQADTQLVSGLLDYYMRQKRLEENLKEATELALYLREGWVSATWNVTGGEIYAKNPETGQPIYEGDLEFNTHSILDVARDTRNKSDKHSWYIVSEQINKWDLVAKYPELKDEILAIQTNEKYQDILDISYNLNNHQSEEDQIVIKTFYHEKTPAMPEGRMVQFLSEDVVLFDGPLPYKKVYLFKITPSKAFKTAFGHSNAMDLMPLQDALDAEFSTILTNHNAFGVQNIMAPKGSGVSVNQIADGLNLIEYDKNAGPPSPLNLAQTPPEIFNFAEMLIRNQELISGQNQVSRGNPPSQMSGTAMALIANQAIQFQSGIQHSYNMLLENVGSASVELLQTYASTPRVALITGKSKRSLLKKYSNKNLQGISRVIVDAANSLSKTAAGKVEMANNLLNSGLIKTPEQYISVVTTGTLEPLYEHEQSQINLIRQENESLAEGRSVRALITDDHSLHAIEHSVVLNSPEARENEELAANILAHIQEHINLAKSIPPELAEMLKHTPIQSKQPPQAPLGQVPNTIQNENPITTEANSTSLPDMPIDALTGEKFTGEPQ